MTARGWTSARAVKLWLDVVLVLGGIATVLLVLWALVSPLIMRQGRAIPADVSTVVAIGPHSVVPRMSLEFEETGSSGEPRFDRVGLIWGYGELRAETFDWGLHIVGIGLILVVTLVALWAIWNLREVVRTALAGEPFAAANSRRLRRIGLTVLGLTIAMPLVEYPLGRYLLEQVSVEGLTLSPALRFSKDWFLGGLLFLVLAAIFRHGTELEEERALTV